MKLNDIYNIDCLEGMKTFKNESVDFVLTSPPYDNLRSYEGNSDFNFKAIAKELYRVVKNGGAMVWVVGDSTKDGNESGTSFRQALYFQKIGFKIHDTMIYQKANYIPLTHKRV